MKTLSLFLAIFLFVEIALFTISFSEIAIFIFLKLFMGLLIATFIFAVLFVGLLIYLSSDSIYGVILEVLEKFKEKNGK